MKKITKSIFRVGLFTILAIQAYGSVGNSGKSIIFISLGFLVLLEVVEIISMKKQGEL